MSGHEQFNSSEQFDLHNELYESFRQATVRDVCRSFDQAADPSDISYEAHNLAKLGFYEALPYLDNAREVAMADMTEDCWHDITYISEGYASLGRFDIALDMMDAVDRVDPRRPGRRTHREVLFYWNAEKIPEVYLETALQAYLQSGYTENTYTNIYLLADKQPAIRQRALEVMEQLAFEHILPSEPEQWKRQRHLQLLVESAGAWGRIDKAREWHAKIETAAWRLAAELSVAKKTGQYIDHTDGRELYDNVLANPAYSDDCRAWMLRSFKSMGYNVDPTLVRYYIKRIDDREQQIREWIDYYKVFDDTTALREISTLVTPDDIRDRSYLLLGYLEPTPGLLVANAPAILTALLDPPADDSRLDMEYMARHLIEDYIAVDDIPEAMEIAQICRDRGVFHKFVYNQLQRDFVAAIAKKGRESFEEAYAQMATSVSEAPNNAYLQSALLSSLTVAAYDYLTSEERDYYLGVCDTSSLFRDWLELAKTQKRLDLLVIARQYVPEQASCGRYTYQKSLIDILTAYEQIVAG